MKQNQKRYAINILFRINIKVLIEVFLYVQDQLNKPI